MAYSISIDVQSQKLNEVSTVIAQAVARIEVAANSLASATRTNAAGSSSTVNISSDIEELKRNLSSVSNALASSNIGTNISSLETALNGVIAKFRELDLDTNSLNTVFNTAVREEINKIKIAVNEVTLDLRSEINRALKTEGVITVGSMQLGLKNIIQNALSKEGVVNVAAFSVNLAQEIQSQLASKVTLRDIELEIPESVRNRISNSLDISNISDFKADISTAINNLSSKIAQDISSLKLFSDESVVISPVNLTSAIQAKLNSIEIDTSRILIGQLIQNKINEQGLTIDPIRVNLLSDTAHNLQAIISTDGINRTVNLVSDEVINLAAEVTTHNVDQTVNLVSEDPHTKQAEVTTTEVNPTVSLVNSENIELPITITAELFTMIDGLQRSMQSMMNVSAGLVDTIPDRLNFEVLQTSFQSLIDRIADVVANQNLQNTNVTTPPTEQQQQPPTATTSQAQQNTNRIQDLFTQSVSQQSEIARLAQTTEDPSKNNDIQRLIKEKIKKLREMLTLVADIDIPDPATIQQIATEFTNLRAIAARGQMGGSSKGEFSKVLQISKTSTDPEIKAAYDAVYSPLGGTRDINAFNNIPAFQQKPQIIDQVKSIEGQLTNPNDFQANIGFSGNRAKEIIAREEEIKGNIDNEVLKDVTNARTEARNLLKKLQKENSEEFKKYIRILRDRENLGMTGGGGFFNPNLQDRDLTEIAHQIPYNVIRSVKAKLEDLKKQSNVNSGNLDWGSSDQTLRDPDGNTVANATYAEDTRTNDRPIPPSVQQRIDELRNDPSYYRNNDKTYGMSDETSTDPGFNFADPAGTANLDDRTINFPNAPQAPTPPTSRPTTRPPVASTIDEDLTIDETETSAGVNPIIGAGQKLGTAIAGLGKSVASAAAGAVNAVNEAAEDLSNGEKRKRDRRRKRRSAAAENPQNDDTDFEPIEPAGSGTSGSGDSGTSGNAAGGGGGDGGGRRPRNTSAQEPEPPDDNDLRRRIKEARDRYNRIKKEVANFFNRPGQDIDVSDLTAAFNAIPNPAKNQDRPKHQAFLNKVRNEKAYNDQMAAINRIVNQSIEFSNAENADPEAGRQIIAEAEAYINRRKIQGKAKFNSRAKAAIASVQKKLDNDDVTLSDEDNPESRIPRKERDRNLKAQIDKFNKALIKVNAAIAQAVDEFGNKLVADTASLKEAYDEMYPSAKSKNAVRYWKGIRAGEKFNEVKAETPEQRDEERTKNFKAAFAKASLEIMNGADTINATLDNLSSIAASFENETKRFEAQVKAQKKRDYNKKISDSRILNNTTGDSSETEGFNYQAGLARKQIRIGQRPTNIETLQALSEGGSEYDKLDYQDIVNKDLQTQQRIAIKNLRDKIAKAKRKAAESGGKALNAEDVVDFDAAITNSGTEKLGLEDQINNIRQAYAEWWNRLNDKIANAANSDTQELIANFRKRMSVGENVSSDIDNAQGISDIDRRKLSFDNNKKQNQIAKDQFRKEALNAKNKIRVGEESSFDFNSLSGKGFDEEITKLLLDLQKLRTSYLSTNNENNKRFAQELTRQRRNLALNRPVDWEALHSAKTTVTNEQGISTGIEDHEQQIALLGYSANNKGIKNTTKQALKEKNPDLFNDLISRNFEGAEEAKNDVSAILSDDRIDKYVKATRTAKSGIAADVDAMPEVNAAYANLTEAEKQITAVLIAKAQLEAKAAKKTLIDLVKAQDTAQLQAGADAGLEGYQQALDAVRKNQQILTRTYADYIKEINKLLSTGIISDVQAAKALLGTVRDSVLPGKTKTLVTENPLTEDSRRAEVKALNIKANETEGKIYVERARDLIQEQKNRIVSGEKISNVENTSTERDIKALNTDVIKNSIDEAESAQLEKAIADYAKWKEAESKAIDKAIFDAAKIDFKLGNPEDLKAIADDETARYYKQAQIALAGNAKALSTLSAEERASIGAYQAAAKKATTSGDKTLISGTIAEYEPRKLQSTNSIYNDKYDTITNQLKAKGNEDGQQAYKGLRIQDLAISFYTFTNGISMATQALSSLAKVASAYEISVQRLNIASNSNVYQTQKDVGFAETTAKQFSLNRQDVLENLAGYKIANPTNYDRFGTRVGKTVEDSGINKIVTGMAAAGVANQLSAAQMQDASVAIQQMLNKGVVQSEELKRQLSNTIPGAFNLFAQSQGISPKQLEGRLRRNEVTADQLVDFGELLDRMFTDAAKKSNIQRSVNTLVNKTYEATQSTGSIAAAPVGAALDTLVNPLIAGIGQNASLATPGLALIGGSLTASLIKGSIAALKDSSAGDLSKEFLSKFANKDGVTNLGKATGVLFGAALIAAIGTASGGEGLDKLLGRVGKNFGLGIDKITGQREGWNENASGGIKNTFGNDVVSQILPLTAGLYGAASFFGIGKNAKGEELKRENDIRRNSGLPEVSTMKEANANPRIPTPSLNANIAENAVSGLASGVAATNMQAASGTVAATATKSTGMIAKSVAALGAGIASVAAGFMASLPLILGALAVALTAYVVGNTKFVGNFEEAVTEVSEKLRKIGKETNKDSSSGVTLTVDELKNRKGYDSGQVKGFSDWISDRDRDDKALTAGRFKEVSDTRIAEVYQELKNDKSPGKISVKKFGRENFVNELNEEADRRLNQRGQQELTGNNRNFARGLFDQDVEKAKSVASNALLNLESFKKKPVSLTEEATTGASEANAARQQRQALFSRGITSRADRDELEKLNSIITSGNNKYAEGLRNYTKRIIDIEEQVKALDTAIEIFDKQPEAYKLTPEGKAARLALTGARDATKVNLTEARKDFEKIDPKSQVSLAAEKFNDIVINLQDQVIKTSAQRSIETRESETLRGTETNSRAYDIRNAALTTKSADVDITLAKNKLDQLEDYFNSLQFLPSGGETDKLIAETNTKLLEARSAYQESITKKEKARIDEITTIELKAIELVELKRNQGDRVLQVENTRDKRVRPFYEGTTDNVVQTRISVRSNERDLANEKAKEAAQVELIAKTTIHKEQQLEKLADIRATIEGKITELTLSKFAKLRAEFEMLETISKSIVEAAQNLRNAKKEQRDQTSNDIIRRSGLAAPGDIFNTDTSINSIKTQLEENRRNAANFNRSPLLPEVNRLNQGRAALGNAGFDANGQPTPLASMPPEFGKYVSTMNPTDIAKTMEGIQKAIGAYRKIVTGVPLESGETNKFDIGQMKGATIQSEDEGKQYLEFFQSAAQFAQTNQQFNANDRKLKDDLSNAINQRNNTRLANIDQSKIENTNTENLNKLKLQTEGTTAKSFIEQINSAQNTNPINGLLLNLTNAINKIGDNRTNREIGNKYLDAQIDKQIRGIETQFQRDLPGLRTQEQFDPGITARSEKLKNEEIAELNRKRKANYQVDRGEDLNSLTQPLQDLFLQVSRNIPKQLEYKQDLGNRTVERRQILGESYINNGKTEEENLAADIQKRSDDFNLSLKKQVLQVEQESQKPTKKIEDVIAEFAASKDPLKNKTAEIMATVTQQLGISGALTSEALAEITKKLKELGFTSKETAEMINKSTAVLRKKKAIEIATGLVDLEESKNEATYESQDKISSFMSDWTLDTRRKEKIRNIRSRRNIDLAKVDVEEAEAEKKGIMSPEERADIFGTKREIIKSKAGREEGKLDNSASRMAKDMGEIFSKGLKFSTFFRESLEKGEWGKAALKGLAGIADSIADYFSNKAADAIGKALGDMLDAVLSSIDFSGVGKMLGFNSGMLPEMNMGLMPSFAEGTAPKHGSSYPNTSEPDNREGGRQSKAAIINSNEWVVNAVDAHAFVKFKQEQTNAKANSIIENRYSSNTSNAVTTNQQINNNYTVNQDTFRRSPDAHIAINDTYNQSRSRFSKR